MVESRRLVERSSVCATSSFFLEPTHLRDRLERLRDLSDPLEVKVREPVLGQDCSPGLDRKLGRCAVSVSHPKGADDAHAASNVRRMRSKSNLRLLRQPWWLLIAPFISHFGAHIRSITH